jgi:two-component system phosphate regulon sensor histidine kinase PhoR
VIQLLFQTAILVVLCAAGASAAGLFLGATAGWVLFATGVLAMLAYHVANLAKLIGWLRNPQPEAIPEARGIWDEAFALLHKFERAGAREAGRLARALERWRLAGEALPDGVVILDSEDRIEWCNENASRHFGLDPAVDRGRLVTHLVRQPEFVKYVEDGDYSRPLEIRLARGGGIVLSVQLIPYGESQKLMFSRDITQREAVEAMRRDFVANVSHELRTPLTVLAGFLEMARDPQLAPERVRDYLERMEAQAKRMQRIVEDLLTLSTLESTPAPSLEKRVDMRSLIARLRADAEALSGGRHHVVVEATDGLDLMGAESEIASAFGNLVSNAVRYTPEGGTVRILWRATAGGGAEFAVEDTGIGIEAHHIPRLTERFYRVDRGRSRETGGTGLGLAIVKHALLRHQATLDIRSEPGRGSRFSAMFPARRVVAATPATLALQA